MHSFQVFLVSLCFTIGVSAQSIQRNVITLETNLGLGNKVSTLNFSVIENVTITKKKLYLLFGARARTSIVGKDLTFSPPVSSGPTFNTNQQQSKVSSINIFTGVKVVITPILSINFTAELIGVAFGNTLDGTMVLANKNYTYLANVSGTSFILSDRYNSNLMHTLEMGYLISNNLRLKLGIAKHSIAYNYRSTSEMFKNFTKGNSSIVGIIGIEWMVYNTKH